MIITFISRRRILRRLVFFEEGLYSNKFYKSRIIKTYEIERGQQLLFRDKISMTFSIDYRENVRNFCEENRLPDSISFLKRV